MSVKSKDDEIKELQHRVTQLESELMKVKRDLIPLMRNVTEWHVHGSNGKIYWEIPDKVKKELSSKSIKDKMPRPDDELKIIQLEP